MARSCGVLGVGFPVVALRTGAAAVTALAAVAVGRGALDLMRSAAQAVIDGITFLWHTVAEPFISFLQGAWNAAWEAARGPVNLLKGAIQAVIDIIGAAVRKVGDLKDALSNIPGIGTLGDVLGGIGSLNPFQHGGFVDAPASGMLATLHGRELVLPLDDERRALKLLGQSGLVGSIATSGSPLATVTPATSLGVPEINVSITVNAPGATAADADRIATASANAAVLALERRRLVFSARTAS